MVSKVNDKEVNGCDQPRDRIIEEQENSSATAQKAIDHGAECFTRAGTCQSQDVTNNDAGNTDRPGSCPPETSQQADVGDSNEDSPPSPPLSKRLTYRLYISHFLSTWNSRLFEFGATLFLASIYPDTLLPMSVYALVRNGAAILFSPAVGSWIDHGNRLEVVRISIIGQRLAVAASCAIFWVLEVAKTGRSSGLGGDLENRLGDIPRKTLFAAAVLLSCVEKLCSVMNLVSVERDWVVVITESNESERQQLNAKLRRIDLLCKLLGPLAISLISTASTIIAIWATLGMSLASIVFEYICIARVYFMVPGLRHREPMAADAELSNQPADSTTPLVGVREIPLRVKLKTYALKAVEHLLPIKFFPFYFSHPSAMASIALALLYLTVLSFSGQMITFLLATGYTSLHVGIARTVSTVVELMATWIAPRVAKKIGTVRGGIWFLAWQMAWLAAGVSFFFAEGRGQGSNGIKAVSGLVAGVILSRVGLWGLDLCAQSIVQDTVDFSHRGAFSTVEAALQNLCELLSYVSTIIFSRPDQFQWPVVISVVATYLAGALFASFVRRKRGHLLHAPSCIPARYLL